MFGFKVLHQVRNTYAVHFQLVDLQKFKNVFCFLFQYRLKTGNSRIDGNSTFDSYIQLKSMVSFAFNFTIFLNVLQKKTAHEYERSCDDFFF